MSKSQDIFWEFQRHQLQQILYRIGIGLEDKSDLCIASGILSQFLESQDLAIVEQAKLLINQYPQLKDFFPQC